MKYFKDLISFFTLLVKQRYMIFQLTKRDFQSKYLASYLGLPWAFIQPGVTIAVMWFVFSVGFKTSKVDTGVVFTPWLIIGMIAWNFIIESINGATSSLLEYSFLIKKVYFRPSIIPLIKILTALIIHTFFIFIAMFFAIIYGYYPTLYWLQIFYYLLCSVVLVLGIGWLTSALNVFVRDIGQAVGVVLQLLFWSTPIFWHFSILEGNLRFLAYLNPVFYIINGYRESLFSQMWFFEHLRLTAYFWFVALFFFVFGALVFSRLKKHFADVL